MKKSRNLFGLSWLLAAISLPLAACAEESPSAAGDTAVHRAETAQGTVAEITAPG